MALQDQLKQLNEIDFSNLDANNIGMWPFPLKVLVLIAAFAVVLGGGSTLKVVV